MGCEPQVMSDFVRLHEVGHLHNLELVELDQFPFVKRLELL